MEYVDNYKYLGCWINEFGNNFKTVQALTAAGSQSYGYIIGLVNKFGDLGYKTFMTLYEAYVWPIINYGAQYGGTTIIRHPRYCRIK